MEKLKEYFLLVYGFFKRVFLRFFDKNKKGFIPIYKKFLKQIPKTHYLSIKKYQHFIVLGEMGSGKTSLIKNYIQNDRDFYPFETIYTSNAHLGVYLGPNQIVQELSWSILSDRSMNNKKNLIRFWKYLFSNKCPTVVLTINVLDLLTLSLEELQEKTSILSSKLCLLNHITKTPIKIRTILTHLEKIEGFSEFSQFAHSENIELELKTFMEVKKADLNSTFEVYKKYFSKILLSTSGDQYLKILSFFKQMPEYLKKTDSFIDQLLANNPNEQSLSIESTFIIPLSPNCLNSNPFKVDQYYQKLLAHKNLFTKNQVVTGICSTACFIYFGSSYIYESSVHQKIQNGIKQFEQHHSLNEIINNSDNLYKIIQNQIFKKSFFYLPKFFDQKYEVCLKNIFSTMDNSFWESKFRQLKLEDEHELKNMYLSAILYANNSNKLGKLVIENAQVFEKIVHIPKELIICHVLLANVDSKKLSNNSPALSLKNKSPFNCYDMWVNFFQEADKLCKNDKFSENRLLKLIEKASYLKKELESFKKYDLAFFISISLECLNNQNYQTIQWLHKNATCLESLLSIFTQETLSFPSVENLNLKGFLDLINHEILSRKNHNQQFSFYINDYTFELESKNWQRVCTYDFFKKLVQKYIKINGEYSKNIFFKGSSKIPAIDLNYFQSEHPFHKFPIEIPGDFTKYAVEMHLLNLKESYHQILEANAIDKSTKIELQQYIHKNTQEYAKEYKDTYKHYIHNLYFQNNNLEQTILSIEKMSEPVSSFYDFLQVLRENLCWERKEIPFMEPFKILDEFQYLNLLLDKDEKYIDQYFMVLRDMLDIFCHKKNEESPYEIEAQIALDNIKNNTESYICRVNQILDKIEIPSEYKLPFLSPIYKIQKFGLKSLENSVLQVFENEIEPKFRHIKALFPFNKNNSETATISQLEEVFHPEGKVTSFINEIIIPISEKAHNKYVPSFPSDFDLGKNTYRVIDQIKYISHLLWNENGQPKPILLKIKATPFSKNTNSDTCVSSMHYLIFGDHSVFNFNQKPKWETVEYQWWKEDNSLVGLEYLDIKKGEKTYANKKAPKGTWNLLKLLNNGEEKMGGAWSWDINLNTSAEEKVQVAFVFENSPWKLLDIDQIKTEN